MHKSVPTVPRVLTFKKCPKRSKNLGGGVGRGVGVRPVLNKVQIKAAFFFRSSFRATRNCMKGRGGPWTQGQWGSCRIWWRQGCSGRRRCGRSRAGYWRPPSCRWTPSRRPWGWTQDGSLTNCDWVGNDTWDYLHLTWLYIGTLPLSITACHNIMLLMCLALLALPSWIHCM